MVGEVLLPQVDDLVPSATLALRLVHRGVGILQELLRPLVAPCSVQAMPTLMVMATSMPDSTNGVAKAASIRAATASISAGASRSSQRMTNSSPDIRASVSPGRIVALSRSATATRSWSPTRWP